MARLWARGNKDRVSAAKQAYYAKNKDIQGQKNREWAKDNQAKMLEYGRKSWAKNSDKRNATKRAYRAANKQKQREYYLRYHALRPGLKASWDAVRRAAELRAMPSWTDKGAIAAIFRDARVKSKETGVRWHVDHIVPLQHELVCGLHVPANLQLLPGAENVRKNNRFVVA